MRVVVGVLVCNSYDVKDDGQHSITFPYTFRQWFATSAGKDRQLNVHPRKGNINGWAGTCL